MSTHDASASSIASFEGMGGIFESDGRPLLNVTSKGTLSAVARACSHLSMKFLATSAAASPRTQTRPLST